MSSTLATNGGRLFAPVWETAAQVLGVTFLVAVVLPMVSFVYMNFVVAEEKHPLDYYSNRLRTRPFYFVGILGFFAALGTTAIVFPDVSGFVIGAFPELAVAMYLQGLVIVGILLRRESAAAALTGALFYSIAGIATALIVTIPEIPVDRPGALYANAFLLANIVWVLWVSLGVGRRRGQQHRLLPQGAECVPRQWSKAVLWGNPALLLFLDSFFGVLWQLERGDYGLAFSISYILVATLLLLGCCYNFRAGTEVEDVIA